MTVPQTNTSPRSSTGKTGKTGKSIPRRARGPVTAERSPAGTRGRAEEAPLATSAHRSAMASGPSWPTCRSAPSRRQTSTSATAHGGEGGLRPRSRAGAQGARCPLPAPTRLAPRDRCQSPPDSSRSPCATYGGHAAAVGQRRLGQALPGERSSAAVRGGLIPQQPTTSPPGPAAHTPSFPRPRGPALQPAGKRELTREHACDP